MKTDRTIKSIGRRRRVLGWVLVSLGVAVAGVWLLSLWKWVNITSADGERAVTATIENGHLWLSREPWDWSEFSVKSGGVSRPPEYWSWMFVNLDGCTRARVPLWPVALVGIGAGWGLIRSGLHARRRQGPASCRGCGYSLAGLPGAGERDGGTDAVSAARCPECGRLNADSGSRVGCR